MLVLVFHNYTVFKKTWLIWEVGFSSLISTSGYIYVYICIYMHIYVYIYICHRHEIWVKEKTERFRSLHSNWGLWCWCWQICRQTTACPVHMCSGFPNGRSEQTIMMSWNDVTVISCATLGGNYKRRAHTNLRAVIWVFGYWAVGSTDKSQTLYSGYLGVSHGAEHNQSELCALFVHMHVLRLLGEPFSQYDFSCLMLAR